MGNTKINISLVNNKCVEHFWMTIILDYTVNIPYKVYVIFKTTRSKEGGVVVLREMQGTEHGNTRKERVFLNVSA